MNIHSLRWRLQLWHGLLLVLVLAGFGVTAYELQRAESLRRIDQQLDRRVNEVLATLREGQPRPRPDDDDPGPEGPRDPPPDRRPMPPAGFRLSQRFAMRFGTNSQTGAYYALWARDGRRIGGSDNVPGELDRPTEARPGASAIRRTRGMLRETVIVTPPGEAIVVGQSMATDLEELGRFGGWLGIAGAGVLTLSLAGGWWVVTRAIRPIEAIGATAERIATGRLAERIPVAETDSELGKLAGVLNETFARLEAAFQRQERFTADASHELRTPVSVIISQAQSALARERPAGEYRDALAACERAAQRMRRLIESLLELARLDAGATTRKETVDLARLAEETIALVRPLAEMRGLQWTVQLAPATCVGDPGQLGQVLANLLANAIDYNRDGGGIRVTVGPGGDGGVAVEVADTGIGVGPEALPHLFERFYRADPSRTGSKGRAGLGLAIVKTIVEAHGGTIEVASEPGKGTKFTLRLRGS
ncbi:MAG: HAMP domain-containing protein [Verrucomicrobia bacterium]|nr:MAG: HAMP domain-containing protein [Verrucomicrobiota bacterium]